MPIDVRKHRILLNYYLFSNNLCTFAVSKEINYLLGVVMFGMGLTLNLMDFKIVFSRHGALFSVWHNISGAMVAY